MKNYDGDNGKCEHFYLVKRHVSIVIMLAQRNTLKTI